VGIQFESHAMKEVLLHVMAPSGYRMSIVPLVSHDQLTFTLI
jgi:hypothetical protein